MPPTTMQNSMANIALCRAIYWADGVPAETRLNGIGRILGFDRATIETEATDAIAAPVHDELKERRELASRNAGTSAQGNTKGTANTANQAGPRADSQRGKLLTLIRDSAGNGGLSRGEILDYMGIKGDKSAEMSVSNGLTALTKQNLAWRKGGKYFPVEGAQQYAQQGALPEQVLQHTATG